MNDTQLREALIALQLAWEHHDDDSHVTLTMKETSMIHAVLAAEWEARGYGIKDGRPIDSKG